MLRRLDYNSVHRPSFPTRPLLVVTTCHTRPLRSYSLLWPRTTRQTRVTPCHRSSSFTGGLSADSRPHCNSTESPAARLPPTTSLSLLPPPLTALGSHTPSQLASSLCLPRRRFPFSLLFEQNHFVTAILTTPHPLSSLCICILRAPVRSQISPRAIPTFGEQRCALLRPQLASKLTPAKHLPPLWPQLR